MHPSIIDMVLRVPNWFDVILLFLPFLFKTFSNVENPGNLMFHVKIKNL